MTGLGETGRIELPGTDSAFAAGRGTVKEIASTMRRYHSQFGYLLDPHTAVGVTVAHRFLRDDEPMVCLATAHPAKFPDTIRDAVGEDLAHHPIIDALAGLPTRCTVLPAKKAPVQSFIRETLA